MVVGLLDTSVVIDLLRLHVPARTWLARESQLGISPIVWLEVIQGIKDRATQRKVLKQLALFDQIDPTSEDFQWAIRQAIHFRLSHNIGAVDCLIAATSQRLQVPLYTTNLKHFALLLGPLARKPY